VKSVSVIIPAYKPDEKLLATLSDLVQTGFTDILVVDDGSGAPFAPIFEQVKAIPECTLLRHEVNRGKGAALKTAMRFFLDNRPEGAGVVTADADGQHLAADIAAVAQAMLEKGSLILGVRDFSAPDVPPRSKTGNRITIAVFRLFFGMKISDTQTGLRAFPRKHIAEIAAVSGDRYEFETNMLFLASRNKLPLDEVKIHTVYIEENRSSHFRVVRDSLRIYALIIKYLVSSVGSAVLDEGVFYLFKRLLGSGVLLGLLPATYIAAFLARVISSLFNYFVNAKVVFGGSTGKKTLIRYYILAAVQLALSATLVFLLEKGLSVSSPALSTLIKTLIDTFLFFFSFRIQHKWVFNTEKERREV